MAARRFARFGAIGVLVTLGVTACAANSGRGAVLYSEGRYIEAAEVFERTASRVAEASDQEQLEYSLYRGLTFVALGDYARARDWLRVAYRMGDARPNLVDATKRQLLEQAWRTADGSTESPRGGASTLARAEQ